MKCGGCTILDTTNKSKILNEKYIKVGELLIMKNDRFELAPLGEAFVWLSQNKREAIKDIWDEVSDVEDRELRIKLLLKEHPEDLSLDLSTSEVSQLTREIGFVTHT